MFEEFTFLRFDIEIVIVKDLEGLLNTIDVKNSVIVGGDEHIIHVNEKPSSN